MIQVQKESASARGKVRELRYVEIQIVVGMLPW